MTRRGWIVVTALAAVGVVVGACSSLSPFVTPGSPEADALREVGEGLGFPWIGAAVTLLNSILVAVGVVKAKGAGKAAAEEIDAAPYSDADVDAMVVALRERGYRIEKQV